MGGVLWIQGPDEADYLLFSFLWSIGTVGDVYFASTDNLELLGRFEQDLHALFCPEIVEGVTITVLGGPDITIAPADDERIFLPPHLQGNIEGQVFSFFENAQQYQSLRLRHRRFKASVSMLCIKRSTTESSMEQVLSYAADHAPGILIMEDMDSLMRECCITCASLLSQLEVAVR